VTLRSWLDALLHRTPAVPSVGIAELREDTLTRISGVVRVLDDASLIAPLSRRACVYYAVEVVRERRLDALRQQLAFDQRWVPFEVDDGARAVIDPIAARFSAEYDVGHPIEGTSEITPVERELFERTSVDMRDWWDWRLRVKEAVVEVGQTVAVLGSAVRERDPYAGHEELYRSDGATRFRFAGSPRYPLVITIV